MEKTPTIGTVCHRKHLSHERLQVIAVASNIAIINEIGFIHTVSPEFFTTNYITEKN